MQIQLKWIGKVVIIKPISLSSDSINCFEAYNAPIYVVRRNIKTFSDDTQLIRLTVQKNPNLMTLLAPFFPTRSSLWSLRLSIVTIMTSNLTYKGQNMVPEILQQLAGLSKNMDAAIELKDISKIRQIHLQKQELIDRLNVLILAANRKNPGSLDQNT